MSWLTLHALAKPECRPRIREFISHLRQSPGSEVVTVSCELLDKASELYHEHGDKEWTLTDCVSFVVMRERELTETLTQDRHFEQAGFIWLLK